MESNTNPFLSAIKKANEKTNTLSIADITNSPNIFWHSNSDNLNSNNIDIINPDSNNLNSLKNNENTTEIVKSNSVREQNNINFNHLIENKDSGLNNSNNSNINNSQLHPLYQNTIPYCQICLNHYDDNINSPIVIQCGHTFCKQCVKRILEINNSNNINSINIIDSISSLQVQDAVKNKKDKCPVCKKPISNKDLVPNFELLSLICNQRKKIDNLCELHTNENLNFYCNTCKILICQMCLFLNHIGHELKRPQDSELSKSLETFSSFNSVISEIKEKKLTSEFELNEMFSIINTKIEKTSRKLKEISDYIKLEHTVMQFNIEKMSNDLDEVSPLMRNEYDSIIKQNKKTKINDGLVSKFIDIKESINKIKNRNNEEYKNEKFSFFNSINNNLDDLKSKLVTLNPEIVVMDEIIKNSSFSNMLNPIEFLSDQRITSIRYNDSSVSKEHKKLMDLASMRTECENEFIINIMKSIDRADFVPAITSHTYSDTPLMIGWNTTISAPHMHMLTISYLSRVLSENFMYNYNYKNITDNQNNIENKNDNIKSISNNLNLKTPFLKALDIGSGSGYMTLALSKMLGPNSQVFGIDHIKDIVDYAKTNISKNHKHYLNSKQIIFKNIDGKNGLVKEGKFNVIHVGAAVQEFPQILFDQLENEGYMWIPVGPQNAFKKIYLVYKDNKGEITKKELLTCSYAEMTSKEDQLSHIEEQVEGEYSSEESFS